MKAVILTIAVGSALSLIAYNAMAYEEPGYRVLKTTGDYEIRSYDSYLVAETVVDGNFRQSGDSAFSILAGYIFGNNRDAKKMQMTVPVTSEKQADAGTKMNMTVPVTSRKIGSGDGNAEAYAYQFVMEKKYTLETLPRPNDPRVILKEIPEKVVAARRYSGSRRGKNFEDNSMKLIEALARDGIEVTGKAQAAFYNGPWTPPFMRRNEVLIEVALDSELS